nr:NADPH-dependent F420 reductase [Propionicimonas sp.]
MATFSIIGTGNMGTAIGGLLADGGAAVAHISHEEVGRAPLGDVVVLAVPYPALDGIVTAYGDRLAGRVVVDITNPVDFEVFEPAVPAGSSAAAELQEKLPSATVVKAFNTNFAATLASRKTGGQPTTVLIAGDDADAKQVLADAVTAGGLGAIDAGPLARASQLEALGFLQLTLAIGQHVPWTGGFAVVR